MRKHVLSFPIRFFCVGDPLELSLFFMYSKSANNRRPDSGGSLGYLILHKGPQTAPITYRVLEPRALKDMGFRVDYVF